MYKKSIISFLCLSGLMLLLFAAFNYHNDPFCFFKCENFSAQSSTANYYLYPAQYVLKNPDAEVIILGSSRGENVPEKWIDEKTGLKTINLSTPGADVVLKTTLLNFAKAHLKNLKLVIWQVDYFELTRQTTSEKVLYAEPYFKYQPFRSNQISYQFKKMKALIDHKTFEAILKYKKGTKPDIAFKLFKSTDSYEKCLNFSFEKADHEALKANEEVFKKHLIKSLQGLDKRFMPRQDAQYVDIFKREIKKLEEANIPVVILALPYHKIFWERFKRDNSQFIPQYEEWLQMIENLKSEKVQFSNYNWDFPEDNQSEFYWDDANHLQCNFYIYALEKHLLKAVNK